ncbi:hypothetical protein [Pseudomonas nunensis]|uniref:hypothetical protein n=1 Tax=Pseudomonas nunensis TaxID=2961896 RepID=UPI0006B58BB3|nr:hypothetical protein [Pseudomonas nunensis]KOX99392.1 hypothetical protein AM274_25870 [Pseudomonas nunensis]
MKESWDWHNELIKNPEYVNSGDPDISWELDKSVATILDDVAVINWVKGFKREWLGIVGCLVLDDLESKT